MSVKTNLSYDQVKTNEFRVIWEVTGVNVSMREYEVYIDELKVLSTRNTIHTFNNLKPNTEYKVKVRMIDIQGNIYEFSEEKTITTLSADKIPPSSPSGLTATNIMRDRFTVTWEKSTDNNQVLNYGIHLDGKFLTFVSQNTYTFVGLEQAKRYSVTVRSQDTNGNLSNFSKQLIVTTSGTASELNAPNNLKNTKKTISSAKVTWSRPVGASSINSYEVYVDKELVGESKKSEYELTKLEEGKNYQVNIKAKDKSGKISDFSPTLNVQTEDKDKTQPTVPSNIKYTPVKSNSFTISWENSKDNIKIANYDVYLNGNLEKTVIKNTYTFLNVKLNQEYRIKIRARDTSNNVSEFSQEIIVSPQEQALPATVSRSNNFYINGGELEGQEVEVQVKDESGNPVKLPDGTIKTEIIKLAKNNITIKWFQKGQKTINNYGIILRETNNKSIVLYRGENRSPLFKTNDLTLLSPLKKATPYELIVTENYTDGTSSTPSPFDFSLFNLTKPPEYAKIIKINLPEEKKAFGVRAKMKIPNEVVFDQVGGTQIINLYIALVYDGKSFECGISTIPSRQIAAEKTWRAFANDTRDTEWKFKNGDEVELELSIKNGRVFFEAKKSSDSSKNFTHEYQKYKTTELPEIGANFEGFSNCRIILTPYVYQIFGTPLPTFGVKHSIVEVSNFEFDNRAKYTDVPKWEKFTRENSVFNLIEFPNPTLVNLGSTPRPKQFLSYSWETQYDKDSDKWTKYSLKCEMDPKKLGSAPKNPPSEPKNFFISHYDKDNERVHVAFSQDNNALDYRIFVNDNYYSTTVGNQSVGRIFNLSKDNPYKDNPKYKISVQTRDKGEQYSKIGSETIGLFNKPVEYGAFSRITVADDMRTRGIRMNVKLPKFTMEPISISGYINVYFGLDSLESNASLTSGNKSTKRHECGLSAKYISRIPMKKFEDKDRVISYDSATDKKTYDTYDFGAQAWRAFSNGNIGNTELKLEAASRFGRSVATVANEDLYSGKNVSLSLSLNSANRLEFRVNGNLINTFDEVYSMPEPFEKSRIVITSTSAYNTYGFPLPPWGVSHETVVCNSVEVLKEGKGWIKLNKDGVEAETFLLLGHEKNREGITEDEAKKFVKGRYELDINDMVISKNNTIKSSLILDK